MSTVAVAENFTQINQIRVAVHKQKGKFDPKLPKSIDDIVIDGNWALN